MNLDLFFTLNLLTVGFAAIISLFLCLRNKNNLLLLVLVPVIVFSIFSAFNNVHSMMGFSRSDYLPPDEVLVLQVVIQKKEFIHIWYMDIEAGQPRAIKIPYTEENVKKLQGVSTKLRAGQNAFAKFKTNKQNPTSVDITEYDFSTKFQSKKTQ